MAVGLSALAVVASAGCNVSQDVGQRATPLSQAPRGVLPLRRGQDINPPTPVGGPRALSAPAGAHLSYFGGRVVSNMQVVQVIWGPGSYIPQVTSTASPSMATFYQGVLNSPYVDWLTEYNTTGLPGTTTNQVIGRGSFLSQVTITPSAANNGTTITDDQIQAELSAQLAAGNLPAPTHDAAGNNNTYYAIFFPHGKVETIQGDASCVFFCAYHGTIANAGGMGEVYYGVHPDFQPGSGCENVCGSAATVFGNYTHVASHELIETVTDAEVGLATVFGPPLAWYDQGTNNEIGDLCVGQNGQVVGSDGVTYDVQREFSNSANDCVVSLGPPVVSAVSFSPNKIEGGGTAIGTVTLTRAAPAGGAAVALAGDSAGLVTVPATVNIPAGVSSATFSVTSTAVTAQTDVAITATYPAGTTATGTLTLLQSPTPVSLMLAPTTVQGGNSSTATVTLSGPAPTGGAVVTLASDNTTVATVPATFTIAEGATTGTFTVSTLTQNVTRTANITATYHGQSRSASLTVTLSPSLSQVLLSVTQLESGSSATGTVFLNTVAPSPITVSLSASPSILTIPASVTVNQGLSSATFSIVAGTVSTPTTVTVSGTFPSDVTRTATLSVLPSPTPTSVAIAPNPVTGGQTATGTVTLSKPAPTGGSVVSLASSSPNAPVPATLAIPAGASSGTFSIVTVAQAVTTTAAISASLNGLTRTTTLTINKVLPVGNAAFDPALKAPRCMTVDSFCDSGGLIDGRAAVGPETNQPNTIGATCADGTAGSYHSDESLDRLKVSTVDGTPLAAGKTVKIEASVWVFSTTSDFLDLYFAPDANSPVWTPIATGLLATKAQSLAVVSTTFVLPSATLPAIRGSWRFIGAAAPCTTGSFDDHDDLIFALGATPPVNVAPMVNAGPDLAVTLPDPATLAGTVTDDGLPNPPGAVTITWSTVSGPGTVTFANAAAASTTATFSAAGTYVLRLGASDSALTGSDDVTVTVAPPVPVNQPPVVNAGPDLIVTLPAVGNLAGAATDDGLPIPPGALATLWSVVSGPGLVTFGDPTALATTAVFAAPGSYILRLTANDGALSSSDDVGVIVLPMNQPPVVSASAAPTVTLPDTLVLNGTVSDDGLPNPPGAVTTTWSDVSGNPEPVTFANVASPTTTVTFPAAGFYVLRLTASDGALTSTADVFVQVLPTNHPPIANAPDQTITLPAVASLGGSVGDDGVPNPPGVVTALWSVVSGPGTVVFGDATSPSSTASFSAPGIYVLRLTASDSVLTGSHDVTITVNPQAVACSTASVTNGWQNNAFANQTGTFSATFDATASASPTNSQVAISQGAQTAYTGFAMLVRFSPAGTIDARNGGAFAAASAIPYAAGQTFHFRIEANVKTRTYSVFVTPPGGTEKTVGTNFAFRSEQSAATSVNSWGVHVDATGVGTTTACGFAVVAGAPDFALSGTPASRTVAPGAAATYTATVSGINGFTDVVGLTVSGLPTGSTAAFSPASIAGGAGSSTLTVTTTAATPPGTYPLTIKGTAGSLQHTTTVTLVVARPCVSGTAASGFLNTPFANQTGTFTATFDATPSVSPTDATVAFSRGAQNAYTGFATLVRFAPTGRIDARNGGAFAAASAIPYLAGKTYHFRVVVNVATKRYSVFVTPPGAAELTVGSNFAFRSEQSTVANLSSWAVDVNTTAAGTTTVCGFAVQ